MAKVALHNDGERYTSEEVSANNTVALADSGVVLNQRVDALVTTLPDVAAGNAGLAVIVRLGGVRVTNGPVGTGANESVGHEIAPHSSDKIVGLGTAPAADKSLLMVKASQQVGDYVKLRSNGVDTWFIEEAVGDWTFEA